MYIYFFAFFLPCAHPILFSMKVRSVSVAVFFLLYLINTLSSSCFWGFLKKNTETHMALRGNFSCSVSATDLVEASKDTASLLVCTRKKIFGWGLHIFCE